MRIKTFDVAGATQFAPAAGQGLISLPENLDPRQSISIPKLGITCLGGGIGDVLVYWLEPGGPGRILVSSTLQAAMLDPNGDALLAVCPGAAPRKTTVAPDGTTTQTIWDLSIETPAGGTAKTQTATVSYMLQISPAPNEVAS